MRSTVTAASVRYRYDAQWNPERRVWQLRYDRVAALGLNSRIVDEPASNSGCPGSTGRIFMQMPGAIQIEMLASTVGRQHPVVDDGVTAQ